MKIINKLNIILVIFLFTTISVLGCIKKLPEEVTFPEPEKPPYISTIPKTLKQAEVVPSQPEKDFYAEANIFFQQKNFLEAIQLFNTFIFKNPRSGLVLDAHFKIGKAYFFSGDYQNAVDQFIFIIDSYPNLSKNNLYQSIYPYLTNSYYHLNKFDQSLKILEEIISLSKNKNGIINAHLTTSRIYLKKDNPLEAIEQLLNALKLTESETIYKQIEQKTIEIINIYLKPEELEELVSYIHPGEFPADYATLKLANYYLDIKDYETASSLYLKFLDNFPEHNYSLQVNNLLNEALSLIAPKEYKIGCILPLTGKLANYGKRVFQGIQLALNLANKNYKNKPIILVVKDSEGIPEKAAEAAKELITGDNVITIIGPVLSKSVEKTAEIMNQFKVPLITPTATAKNLPELSPYIFRNCLTNTLQARIIAEYAVNTLGLKKFAVLYSDNKYGLELMNAFWYHIIDLGGEMITIESYQPNQTDFAIQIKKLKGTENLTEEEAQILEEEIGYQPEFEAIFIAGFYDKVGLIAPQLVFHDIDLNKVTLLGCNGWNSPKLIKIGEEYVENGIFTDGFFVDSFEPAIQNFVEKYYTTFEEKPDLLAAQAYDAARILMKTLEEGAETSEEIKEALLKIENFPGISGNTTVTPSGDSIKSIYFLTVNKNKIVQVIQ